MCKQAGLSFATFSSDSTPRQQHPIECLTLAYPEFLHPQGSSSEAQYLLDGLDTTPGQQQGLGGSLGSRKSLGARASLSRARSGQMRQAEVGM